MKGMTTCKVCGRDFALIIEEHYTAQNPKKVGALVNLVSSDDETFFDAFDCPYCGCQNIMQERKPGADDFVDEMAEEIVNKICNDLEDIKEDE